MTGTYILDIPDRLMVGLRKFPSQEDRDKITYVLFWGFIDVWENLDSKYLMEMYRTSFGEFAHHQYLEHIVEDINRGEAEEEEYERVYEVFEKFSHFMDEIGGWERTAHSFSRKLDFDRFINNDEVTIDVSVRHNAILLQVE